MNIFNNLYPTANAHNIILTRRGGGIAVRELRSLLHSFTAVTLLSDNLMIIIIINLVYSVRGVYIRELKDCK